MRSLRSGPVLHPDPTRVVAKPFLPGEMNFGGRPARLHRIVARAAALSDREVTELLGETKERFAGRHRELELIWERHVEAAAARYEAVLGFGGERRELLGALFTLEYAFEAAALTNPSMVPHPVQDGPEGSLRFVLSLRAVGEGHISSITFRTGMLDPSGDIGLDDTGRLISAGMRSEALYTKGSFLAKLRELGGDNEIAHQVLDPLPERFRMAELEAAINALSESEIPPAVSFETVKLVHWLASSNYEVTFGDEPVAERLLFPRGPAESRGMEDARFVRFVDDDGEASYLATYTAWDGYQILPQLIRTPDFKRFRISTLSGSCAQNKGMALFPRKIEGLYAGLSRHDQESIFVMWSDDVRAWNNAELVYPPTFGWEAIQVGNCGSPIETDAGWLVITHGVGPMRRYVLGAILLDLDQPSKVLARLPEPLLEPTPEERDGYVPNVVYSCGGLLHHGRVVIPYGFSDRGTAFALYDLDEILDAMV